MHYKLKYNNPKDTISFLTMMKKTKLMKGMAAMSMTLAVFGCSKNTDLYDQGAKVEESARNFVNNVLGGRGVDPNQTWSTATATTLNVKSEIAEGPLKVYASNPIGNSVPPIYTGTIARGEQKTIMVARPNDVQHLYVVVYDAQNYMRTKTVNVTSNNLNVSFESSNATGAAASRARRAAYQSSYTFPQMAGDENFLSEVPAGVKKYTEVAGEWQTGYATGISYLDESWTQQVNVWGGWDGSKNSGGKLYIKGYNDFTNRRFFVAANTEVYLIEGATLVLNASSAAELQENDNYYIATGAKIITTGELKLNNGLHMYNKGTIEAGKISVNNTSLLYNTNIVKVNGEISVENNNSVIVNDKTITAQSMHTAGSGHFLNTNQCNISGQTLVDSNNNSWVNNGYFHCQNYKYEGGSWNVINNCKLVCDEEFYMNLGQNQGEFKLDGSVECKTFFHGIGYTKMTGKSIIKVAETLTCHADADGCYFGFYGPETADNGYAVVQAKKITANSLTQRRSITYRNYLIVATNDHWEQCDQYDSSVNGNYPYWDQGDNVKMSLKDKNAITETITPTDCNAGISGGPIVIDEPTMYYYYAFEDLGTTDDFDFNDVIIRLSAPVNGTSSVELVAAGGTMETYVTYGEGENPTVLGAEVHSALGSNTTGAMINTTTVDTSKFTVIGTIPVSQNADLTQLPFGIKVKGENGQTIKVTRSVEGNGKAPLVIVVSGNEQGKWFWATERTNITVAYSAFGDWGANVSTNANWYKNPTGAVVSY